MNSHLHFNQLTRSYSDLEAEHEEGAGFGDRGGAVGHFETPLLSPEKACQIQLQEFRGVNSESPGTHPGPVLLGLSFSICISLPPHPPALTPHSCLPAPPTSRRQHGAPAALLGLPLGSAQPIPCLVETPVG